MKGTFVPHEDQPQQREEQKWLNVLLDQKQQQASAPYLTTPSHVCTGRIELGI